MGSKCSPYFISKTIHLFTIYIKENTLKYCERPFGLLNYYNQPIIDNNNAIYYRKTSRNRK